MMMKVISVNVGKPREYEWRGQRVRTAIFKSPVEGPVVVRTLNLEGDGQADLTVHGGLDKAVYAYPCEHYLYWQKQLPDCTLVPGNFGENLTLEGASEEAIHLGDQLQIGTALFTVTQPRSPCYKLGVRFDRDDMTRRFYESRRFGFYLRVLREGGVQPGAELKVVSQDPNGVSVADVIRLFTGDSRDPAVLDRALRVSTLPEGWRHALQERFEGHRGQD
ncbi:MAG: MOSC domain-containing protein [Candidatus Korobacteraceae bacterium]